MIILKFGGAALRDSHNVRNSVNYVERVLEKKPIVVVSALKGITDILIETINDSISREHKNILANTSLLRERHEKIANELCSEKEKPKLLSDFNDIFMELYSLYKSVSVLKECTPKTRDYIISFGEKLSSKLVAAALISSSIESKEIYGEELIITDSNFGYAYPDYKLSTPKINDKILDIMNQGIVPIITGFIGANEKGETTTLGRGGSDFTASILAYCLNADEVWFLKEVDGIMSADPKIVKNARSVKKMSYDEVAELSYFGAKVLHPIAVHPIREKNISSYIKNVYNFDFSGTKIIENLSSNPKKVKAITCIKEASLITVEGKGMSSIPGIAGRIFSCLGRDGINIIMISQSSSEQNICFAISKKDSIHAISALNKEFELEILKKTIDAIIINPEVSIVAVVGCGMKNNPGIAGSVFSALGKSSINVILIAQGSSEMNISFVTNACDAEKAIITVHDEFMLGEK
jgi:aspartate kinase